MRSSLAILLADLTGLGADDGDLYGDPGRPTGLDCPAGVVECGCRRDAVSVCRSVTHEPVLANPSYGVTVASAVRAGGAMGGLVVGWCVAAGRQGYYSGQ